MRDGAASDGAVREGDSSIDVTLVSKSVIILDMSTTSDSP